MDAKELLKKYQSGKCNDAEKSIIESWYLQDETGEALDLENQQIDDSVDRVWAHLEAGVSSKPKVFKLQRIVAAASVLLVIGVGFYFYKFYQVSHPVKEVKNKPAIHDVDPGGNKAFLVLANGKRISLNDAKNGSLAQESGVQIVKKADGQLVYSVVNTGKSNVFNTIETPRGGQYQVQLPDGTKVWLNAASSLKYPTSFTSLKERAVQLTGEAYFEVTKDKVHPFIVKMTRQTVEVLGTHFNINSYEDEAAVRTTLLEGSVRINQNTLLKPGEQSKLTATGIEVTEVDPEVAVAWKNGMFKFKNADLQTVLRSIARWYDVEIDYEGKLPEREFSGEIHRNIKLSDVLEILGFYKVHFRIEGKRLTVTP